MTPEQVRVAILGATGRMGRTLLRLAHEDPRFHLAAAVTQRGDEDLGRPAGALAGVDGLELPISDRIDDEVDVAIDFTLPAGFRAWLPWCRKNGVALVSGTTGLTDDDHAALAEAGREIAALWAPNMSIGVNLLLALVAQAAERLDPSWDVEIVETHHSRKADAPSGTAKALLQAVLHARGDDAGERSPVTHGRQGDLGPRPAGEIGMHALRLGGNVGEHEVHFASPGEVVTLRHHALSREIFARGALVAAHWLFNRPAGVYQMRDVLR